MTGTRLAFVLLVATMAAPIVRGREMQAGTVVITGTVVTEEGRPVRRALVTLSGGSSPVRQEVTDDSGRFAFPALQPGRFTVAAEKAAYVKTYYGARTAWQPPAMPIAVSAGQPPAPITIRLIRGAVIAGTVRNEYGAPLASAAVRAYQPTFENGTRQLSPALGQFSESTTDERGRYRLFGLPPGDHVVSATGGGQMGPHMEMTRDEIDAATRELQSSGARPPGVRAAPLPTPSSENRHPVMRGGGYYPGSSTALEAQVLTLAAGEERNGIDLVNPVVRVARVEGEALGPDGQPVQVLVGMANLSQDYRPSSAMITNPGGTFDFNGLGPGRYLFFGRSAPPPGGVPRPGDAPPSFASAEVTIGADDIVRVTLRLEAGRTLSGRLASQQSASWNPSAIRLTLNPAPGVPGPNVLATAAATVQADGSFTFANLAPGKYRITATAPAGWFLRSAVLDGRDTLDALLDLPSDRDISGLVVAFTDRPTEVSGTLTDQLGRPAPEYAVVMFPADRALWTTAPRRMSGPVKLAQDGTFRVAGLPPGDYYLGAVTEVSPGQLADLAFLDRLVAWCLKISLGEGETKVQNLRLGQSAP